MIKNFYLTMFIPIFLSIFISFFFTPFLSTYHTQYNDNAQSLYSPKTSISNSHFQFTNQNTLNFKNNFLWPAPGYTKITSDFGYRKAPTTGAGTYHGGIDIAAPENSSIISIADGIVSFVGWYGANGYTVIIHHANGYQSIYGHISPNFIISEGDKVQKGQLIAKVGPKYIEATNYTNYIDKNGKYTNGATTRSPSPFFYIHQ